MTRTFWTTFRGMVMDAPIVRSLPPIDKTPESYRRLHAALAEASQQCDALYRNLTRFNTASVLQGSSKKQVPLIEVYEAALDFTSFLSRHGALINKAAGTADLVAAALADEVAGGAPSDRGARHLAALVNDLDKLAESEKEEKALRARWASIDIGFLKSAPQSPKAGAEVRSEPLRTGASGSPGQATVPVQPKPAVETVRSPLSPELQARYEAGLKAYRDQRQYGLAVKHLLPAAQAGHPGAQYYYGLCLAEGRGIAKNESEAARWWEKSAHGGWTDAQLNLAIAYDKGYLGVTPDQKRALYWYKRAAESGGEQEKRWLGSFEERLRDQFMKERKLDPKSLRRQYGQ